MKIKPKDYRVSGKKKLRLGDWPTSVDPLYSSDDDLARAMKADVKALSDLQTRLYAHNRYALLVIFQAMDAAGKDSAIKHVLSGVNPQGCDVYSFKQPSAEEIDHDFLWRTTKALPERGKIGIFNRSYYEEVLVVRVHRELLRNERLPDDVVDDDIWDHRYESIRNFERHLYRNGTRVIKIYLHLSKGEQRERFLRRIDRPDKFWKFSAGDVEERKHWDDYMKAYETCLGKTSTREAPWYVVPADDKGNARLIIARIIAATLEKLPLTYPQRPERDADMVRIRKQLAADR